VFYKKQPGYKKADKIQQVFACFFYIFEKEKNDFKGGKSNW
jgi:hypothetical protein